MSGTYFRLSLLTLFGGSNGHYEILIFCLLYLWRPWEQDIRQTSLWWSLGSKSCTLHAVRCSDETDLQIRVTWIYFQWLRLWTMLANNYILKKVYHHHNLFCRNKVLPKLTAKNISDTARYIQYVTYWTWKSCSKAFLKLLRLWRRYICSAWLSIELSICKSLASVQWNVAPKRCSSCWNHVVKSFLSPDTGKFIWLSISHLSYIFLLYWFVRTSFASFNFWKSSADPPLSGCNNFALILNSTLKA